jgi:predicted ATPase
VRISLFGGLHVEHDGRTIVVSGAMQLAVFFRLAVDAGRAVSVREIVEDVWSADAPENEKAALQSVISRLRSQLPPGSIESTLGGYRLVVAREDVDALVFEDLAAVATSESAQRAIDLWTGEPWTPSPNFDWFERDLRRDHAKLLSLAKPAPRSTIPAPLTSLVGRDVELAMIAGQLESSRLVTIVGTGGAGKTRLAIETAIRSSGAVLVELAPAGPGEVLAAVLTATGRDIRVEKATDRSTTYERVREALYGRDVLLVLDNCEHVIGEAAVLAEDLLSTLPQLRILATSREPLAIPGEAFVAVGSLPNPRDGDTDLLSFAAVELFRQRASAARGTDLTAPEIETAARIATRLDGLPLALELAAAKLRTMTIDEVYAGLERRFELLNGGYRTALPRHQTLRAMIDWSWSLLGDDERFVLARLAVFPSGVDAHDSVALAESWGIPASVFESLVDKSLVQRSRGRFRTLETIREYGLERLAEQGQTADARAEQARHAAGCAVRFDEMLRGPRINEAIVWFDSEEDNLAAALRFATSAGDGELAIRLVISCTWYWIVRERQADAQQWFVAVLPLAVDHDSAEGRILSIVGPMVAALSGTHDEDVDPMEEIERQRVLLAPLADVVPVAGSHVLMQIVPPLVSAFGAASIHPDWMLTVRIPSGETLGLDAWPTALLHVVAAAMAQNRGDIVAHGEESAIAVRSFEEIGDLWGLALAQQMRAEWLAVQGRLDEALAITDASTESMRSLTSTWDLAQQQGLAITVLIRQGRLDEASRRVDSLIVEAVASENARTMLQAQLTASGFDLAVGNADSLASRLALVDELAAGLPGIPQQLFAWVGVNKAGLALLSGDTDAAELHLRAGATAALASRDQPVVGMVAVRYGMLALARGDLEAALDAVDLATAVIGMHDATDPYVRAIEQAAEAAHAKRASARTLTRSDALEALTALSETSD